MKYIIMCGGKYLDFETPRWLLEVNGEKIVERTIRLLREFGVTDISISSNLDCFDNLGVPVLKHNNSYETRWEGKKWIVKGYWADAFYKTTEPVCYIFGDVWFSKEALEYVVNEPVDDILFFGSCGDPSKGFYKPDEPLAFKVVDLDLFNNSIKRVKYLQDHKLTNRPPISWELYRVIDGVDPNKHAFNKRFRPVTKFIWDVDKPDDLNKLRDAVKKYELLNNIAICAVAKCENDYINDWVNYHLNIGVNSIFIFDNNDRNYEPVESRIKINSGKVYVLKVPGERGGFQTKFYNWFYNKYKDDFGWIIFIDIDEYIVLNKWKTINEFLLSFKDYPVIRLNWHLFGDDELISRDTSIPVNEFFTKRSKNKSLETHGKEIIKGGQSNVNIVSSHYCLINNFLPKQIMPDCKETYGKVGGLRNCEEAYINHYMTKTLDEFINQKLKRRTDAGFPDRIIDFDYYWDINQKTEDKLKYLSDKGLI